MTPLEALKIVHKALIETSGEINNRTAMEMLDTVSKALKEAEQLPPFGNGETNNPGGNMNATEAILGFISYLTTKTTGVSVASGHNPRNIDSLIVIFSEANNLPKARVNWTRMLRFPE